MIAVISDSWRVAIIQLFVKNVKRSSMVVLYMITVGKFKTKSNVYKVPDPGGGGGGLTFIVTFSI